jgi:hypothetical protein
LDTALAEKIFRFYGQDKLNQYLAQFEEQPEDINIPRLYIFETCKHLIDTIPLCVYDETNPEDVAEWSGDDPYDSLRGLLKICDNYLREARTDRQHYEQVEKVLTQLTNTNDQTTFYRQMELIEAKAKGQSFGVRRNSRFNNSRVQSRTSGKSRVW